MWKLCEAPLLLARTVNKPILSDGRKWVKDQQVQKGRKTKQTNKQINKCKGGDFQGAMCEDGQEGVWMLTGP